MSRRTAKPGVDPWRPLDVQIEEERQPGGRRAPALTVFLAGAECPFSCVYCDLWRHTLDGPTPRGAIPAQIRQALERFAPPPETVLKLYNASNFFDDRAVPPEDDEEILRLVAPYGRVVVECHPRLVHERALDYARRLDGRLQIAMGLETVHPEALPRLAKKMTLEGFDRAAATLRAHGAGLRVFVLAGAPFVPAGESVAWTVRSVEHALARGAEHVAIIPLRSEDGGFREPTLDEVEDAFDRSLDDCGAAVPAASRAGGTPAPQSRGAGGTPAPQPPPDDAVVTVDLWDLERLAACPACFPQRRGRLERMNLSGRREPRVACDGCGAGRSAA